MQDSIEPVFSFFCCAFIQLSFKFLDVRSYYCRCLKSTENIDALAVICDSLLWLLDYSPIDLLSCLIFSLPLTRRTFRGLCSYMKKKILCLSVENVFQKNVLLRPYPKGQLGQFSKINTPFCYFVFHTRNIHYSVFLLSVSRDRCYYFRIISTVK